MKSQLEHADAFQIALVTDDPYRVETIREVADEAGWNLVSTVGNKEPDVWVGQQDANIAIVDLDVYGAVAILARLASSESALPVVALATPQHLIELQDALLAGARAFIPFPVNAQQFIGTITRVIQGEHRTAFKTEEDEADQSRVIVVSGLKGGIGRSTLSANLAIALQQSQSSDVILVEAHHGLSDLAILMNLHPNRTLANLAEEDYIDADIIEGNLHVHSTGLKVLTAPTDIAQLVELSGQMWRTLIKQVSKLASTVVVDTAAVADDVLSEILTCADDIIVVTEPEMTSLNGARGLLSSLDGEADIRANLHLLVNRVGLQGSVSTQAIGKRLGHDIVAELPDDPALVTFAINRGIPFTLSHPRAALSREITMLANRFRCPDKAASSTSGEDETGPLATIRQKASVIASLF